MSFLNLSLGELLGLMGAVSAAVVALYLLDRSRRKQVVATLRFWAGADVRTQLQHRRKIQQPWSLVIVLASLLLLLAAIAGPRLGVIDGPGRDHVLILDTSAWMGSQAAASEAASTAPGARTLMDQARESALAYMKSLPRRDRVMLIRADALATPATAFEPDRQIVRGAILASQPGASALNLEQALAFAQRAQRLQSQRPGEIVFIGAGRVPAGQAGLSSVPRGLRVIGVGAPQENVGLRKIGLRRSASQPDTWDIFVSVRNYGTHPHAVDLELQFAGSPAGEKRLVLKPGAEEQANFAYRTRAAGYLEARLDSNDAFPRDNRARIELPAQAALRVVVYSSEPALLRPLIESNPQVQASFEPPAKYHPAVKADVVVLDRFAPSAAPKTNAIWIEPPAAGSPITVRQTAANVRLERWNDSSALGAGLRTRDVVLESAEVLAPERGDIAIAESAAGPLAAAREKSGVKTAVIGFHPGRASMRYQLATPLLMANILRWMAPQLFRRREIAAGSAGLISVPVDVDKDASDAGRASIHVLNESNQPLPFTIENGSLQFFSGSPGEIRVQMGDREMVYSLTLPDVGESVWTPPASVRRGIPRAVEEGSAPPDIWPWLAALGGFGLLLDWLLFGRTRLFRVGASGTAHSLVRRLRQERKAS